MLSWHFHRSSSFDPGVEIVQSPREADFARAFLIAIAWGRNISNKDKPQLKVLLNSILTTCVPFCKIMQLECVNQHKQPGVISEINGNKFVSVEKSIRWYLVYCFMKQLRAYLRHTCSLASALDSASPSAPATLRYLARFRAAISSASSICFL